ncbi:MAG: siroheme synthase CysG [Pseudomonadota bacterium]
MDFLPVFFDVKGQPCLVVGGGAVAGRKIRLLLEAGACVHVVAPQLADAVAKLLRNGEITHRAGVFDARDFGDHMLVFAATDDESTNALVSREAKARRLPINVVDAPALCSFVMPSIIDRSPVVVAVSSGGASPVLARLLRARLETLIPASYGRLAGLVREFRKTVQKKFATTDERRRFWERVLQGPIAEMMFAGQERAARTALEQTIASSTHTASAQGEVYLVGAGPGDPDLLTFRALRLLQQADVLVYDRLVSKQILDLARKDAERIYVGKQAADHVLPQEQINELLVRLAKEKKCVVRLKGGDPFVFGRGGEEIETLMQEGVTFQVVPGITAASGCAAYSGIPLTHRDFAQSVVFATGHLKDNSIDLNWRALIQPHQTIVFYMGLTGLKVICRELIKHGMSPQTPMGLIERGTTLDQKVYVGTLETMPGIYDNSNIKAPTLIIVGAVVNLHEKLKWFEPQQG